MRLAIVKLSALGDIVHASFLPEMIKKHIKDICIDWFVEERFGNILEGNPYIDNIVRVKLKDKKNLSKEIKKIYEYKKNRYDKVIDLQGLIKSASIAKILGNSCGFDINSIREKLASFLYKKKFFIPYNENVIIRNFLLTCKCLDLKINKNDIWNKDKSLYYLQTSKDKIKTLLKEDKKNIVIIVGSSWQSKIYPKEKFLAIVQKIDEHFLLSWGNEKEKEDAKFISQNSNAILLNKMDLDELKAFIDSSDLVIGGDSGPTHIAWAMNKPSITIFGPTPSHRNTLKTNINLTVDCGKNIDTLKLDKDDFCIRGISEEKIIKKVKVLLYG